MPRFIPKSDLEIAELGDDDVLAYILAARAADDLSSAKLATNILTFRHEAIVTARVRLKAPHEHVDEIVGQVMTSAARSSFDGRFVGEFKSWLKTITARRIADFHRSRKHGPTPFPLAEENDGEVGVWVGQDDEELKLADQDLAEQIRCDRPNKVHRAVVQLYGFEVLGFQELDAAATASEIERAFDTTISDANIHKIWSRFLVDYRKAWKDAAGGETT